MQHALIGGLLIGLSGALLLLTVGRIAGISGIINGAIGNPDRSWRLAFLAGLISGGIALLYVYPEALQPVVNASAPRLILSGLLVGLGTVIGGGCTSGHGVCGIGRLSVRSIVATLVFMAAAISPNCRRSDSLARVAWAEAGD